MSSQKNCLNIQTDGLEKEANSVDTQTNSLIIQRYYRHPDCSLDNLTSCLEIQKSRQTVYTARETIQTPSKADRCSGKLSRQQNRHSMRTNNLTTPPDTVYTETKCPDIQPDSLQNRTGYPDTKIRAVQEAEHIVM